MSRMVLSGVWIWPHKMEVTGIAMDWSGDVCLEFDNKFILPREIELMDYSEYYPNGKNRKFGEWPIDPTTKHKM